MALFANKDTEPPVNKSPMPLPQRRPAPEQYARAIQEFHDIQSELDYTKTERDQFRVNLEVEKKENQRLRTEISELKEKVNLYHERIAGIEARFDDAAAIILRVIDSRLTRPTAASPPISIEKFSEDMETEKPSE